MICRRTLDPLDEAVDGIYPNELNRWTLLLGLPMLAACLCIGLAFAVEPWFYAGAIAFGPGLGVFAIIYLAISSDTNATTSAHQLADPRATSTQPRHLRPLSDNVR